MGDTERERGRERERSGDTERESGRYIEREVKRERQVYSWCGVSCLFIGRCESLRKRRSCQSQDGCHVTAGGQIEVIRAHWQSEVRDPQPLSGSTCPAHQT